jgi:hypothetical protein
VKSGHGGIGPSIIKFCTKCKWSASFPGHFTGNEAAPAIIHIYKYIYIFLMLLFFILLSGVRLNPLGTAATIGLLYQPQMTHDGDCGLYFNEHQAVGIYIESTHFKPMHVNMNTINYNI